jgi:hypothetical protein
MSCEKTPQDRDTDSKDDNSATFHPGRGYVIGCSINKELKTTEYTNKLCNAVHKERDVLGDQGRDGMTRLRNRN